MIFSKRKSEYSCIARAGYDVNKPVSTCNPLSLSIVMGTIWKFISWMEAFNVIYKNMEGILVKRRILQSKRNACFTERILSLICGGLIQWWADRFVGFAVSVGNHTMTMTMVMHHVNDKKHGAASAESWYCVAISVEIRFKCGDKRRRGMNAAYCPSSTAEA
jgi:hypothetical protein